jgi:hypothetical protein
MLRDRIIIFVLGICTGIIAIHLLVAAGLLTR